MKQYQIQREVRCIRKVKLATPYKGYSAVALLSTLGKTLAQGAARNDANCSKSPAPKHYVTFITTRPVVNPERKI